MGTSCPQAYRLGPVDCFSFIPLCPLSGTSHDALRNVSPDIVAARIVLDFPLYPLLPAIFRNRRLRMVYANIRDPYSGTGFRGTDERKLFETRLFRFLFFGAIVGRFFLRRMVALHLFRRIDENLHVFPLPDDAKYHAGPLGFGYGRPDSVHRLVGSVHRINVALVVASSQNRHRAFPADVLARGGFALFHGKQIARRGMGCFALLNLAFIFFLLYVAKSGGCTSYRID